MNIREPPEEVPSPCVNVCELNRYAICRGCGRTAREIERWISASSEVRREIRQAAAVRLQQLRR